MTGLTELQMNQIDQDGLPSSGGSMLLATLLGGLTHKQKTASSGTAPALNFQKSMNWFIDMTDNCTVSVTKNPKAPGLVIIRVQQAGAGSKTFTLPSAFKGTYTITATQDLYDYTFWWWTGTYYILIAATKGLTV